jgi:hypothetical protein
LKKLNHQITNLNKTIKELTNRLDEVHPYSSSFANNDQNKNDGINYWKGKKIISIKAWNDLYQRSSIYTDTYKITLASRKPLQYFPDDYNGSISSIIVIDELNEEAQKWNADYYELLEYRKNPTWGRMKCSKCLLSGSLDDPIFNGIEKVFARIISNQCNKNNTNTNSHDLITYHCNVMNIFLCPFESEESCKNREEKEESKYPYKREDLFALQRISFAIEQAITTFFEITKQNEIIYEVDFVNKRVQEIHTKYNGEPESWGWQKNVNEQLSKVKPISNIVIRNEQDIYDLLTNREKLKYLLQEYEKKKYQLEEQEICCDEKSPCVPSDKNEDDDEKLTNSNEKEMTLVDISNYNNNNNNHDDTKSHKGENCHSKKIEELEKSHGEQVTLLKENKQNIIDFLLANKDSILIEDLKSYEPIYKCYREKGNCCVCNILTNIICISCNYNYNDKEVWLCANHWQHHLVEKHNKNNQNIKL